jgi:single-strand DNA-binding protein
MIKLMVIGNLGKDCIVNTVNGKNVINFSVAHTEKFKDSSGAQREKTTWVECAYWTDRTGISPYLKKGTQVYAEGTPEVRTYQTNDGKSGASLSLRVQTVQLLGNKGEGVGGAQPQEKTYSNSNGNSYSSQSANTHANDDINDAGDDLPF